MMNQVLTVLTTTGDKDSKPPNVRICDGVLDVMRSLNDARLAAVGM